MLGDHRVRFGAFWAGAAVAAVLAVSTPLRADETVLLVLLEELVTTHDRVRAAEQDLESSRRGIREARGGFFPELEIDTDFGHLRQINPATNDLSTNFTNYDASVTQLLYDFGETSAEVEAARREHDQFGANLTATRQGLLLEGISA